MNRFVNDLIIIQIGAASITLIFAVIVRLAWRRGKKLQDL